MIEISAQLYTDGALSQISDEVLLSSEAPFFDHQDQDLE